MAETKKEKSDSTMDCPLGHDKSMNYVSRDNKDSQSVAINRIARRLGPHVKVAVCSECSLILSFADNTKKKLP